MKKINVKKMVDKNEEEEEEETIFPVSPTGQYFTSSVLSISVISVLESEIPIDDSCTMTLIYDVFLPINPRFSSIMVRDKNGEKQWKKVEVKAKDHINVANFPQGKSKEFYDNCFNEYLTKISSEQFSQSKPLWEIHLFKYPTSNGSAGCLIFKLHHSLGDGFSLMGALLSCLQRADNPSLPLTFPQFNNNNNNNPNSENDLKKRICTNVVKIANGVMNTFLDFGWGLLKSTNLEDERTPIRSGNEGVEFKPIDITTMEFSLDHLKQIKTNLKVTINDVICGVLFLGVRLYMEEMNYKHKNANSTALVLLNTRNIAGYKSVKEMLQPTNDSKWGNQFAFLHVSVPKLDDKTEEESSNNPLSFIKKAQDVIQRKRNSAAVILTGKLLDTLQKYRGPEVTAKYIYNTLNNSSMTISNMIGPMEKMALANHPVKGLYFMVVGVPESLTITMMSYKGVLRVAVGTEKGLIDPQKFKSSIENAFDRIFKAAVPSASSSQLKS